ncbi:MAG: sodium:solute symporter family protein [Methanocellales archaeon]
MDSYTAFLILLIIYISILILIGWRFVRYQRSIVDFWVAGREIGALNIGFSSAASWLTAGAFLLATGLFMMLGLGSIWIWVAPNIIALALIALLVKKIKNTPALTQPELLEIRYSSMVRAPIAIAITVTMILFSVSDFKGFSYVLSVFFGTPEVIAVIIMIASVSAYVTLGGFRAVVWTDAIQFLFLAGLATCVGLFAIIIPTYTPVGAEHATYTLSEMFLRLPASWWDPFLYGGVAGAALLLLALLPGWVAEQDPWQKIWAAKDEKAARNGLLFGSFLLFLIYFACFLTAVGLNAIYPTPENEPAAEQIYLQFILDFAPSWIIAFFAIGFAAASMSCTDTFATSGASCISRDIIQRHLLPSATQKQMIAINRILVIAMVAIAGFISLHVASIIEAVIIATVIGTTSYFFPIIGGLYWKRATNWGAFAGAVVGFIAQSTLVVLEKMGLYSELFANPLMQEHGVLLGLSLSAIAFIGVSLATKPSEETKLAPFFRDVADRLFKREVLESIDLEDPKFQSIINKLEKKITGARAHLHLTVNVKPAAADGGLLNWKEFTRELKMMHPKWVTPTGYDVVYRLSHGDMLTCVKLMLGDKNQLWLSSEPKLEEISDLEKELFIAYEEIEGVLAALGMSASIAMLKE